VRERKFERRKETIRVRTIKFRTWDTQNKEFSEWTNRDPHFSTSHGQIFFWERTRKEDGSYDGDIILEDHGDRFVLQQFTGLTDKNGKDVYEGDILERVTQSGSFAKVLVRWHDKECCFVYNNVYNLHGEPNPLHDNFVNLCDWTYWVVCGNIFENPELLK